ncbi:MAG: hypothetical protein U0469_00055 [Candidatus Paceibacterota bacterium]|jgi:hypothetical protein
MDKIDLVLKKKGEGYYFFSNPVTDSEESEVFNSKFAGFKILTEEFWDKKLIGHQKTVQLINELAELTDLQISFISTTEDGISQLESDLSTLTVMKEGRDLIALAAMHEDGPTIKRCGCGKHISIVGDGFISSGLSSKKEAKDDLKKLMNFNCINNEELKKLLEEIYALSDFPEE